MGLNPRALRPDGLVVARATLSSSFTFAVGSQAADMTQPETSRAERREYHLISTLKRYVEGLGGELEVFAVFDDDKRVKLKGV